MRQPAESQEWFSDEDNPTLFCAKYDDLIMKLSQISLKSGGQRAHLLVDIRECTNLILIHPDKVLTICTC